MSAQINIIVMAGKARHFFLSITVLSQSKKIAPKI
jgi:hypothetical protein